MGRQPLADEFLVDVESRTTFVDRPLYALLHESIYCDGPGPASAWAAQRERDKRPDLWRRTCGRCR